MNVRQGRPESSSGTSTAWAADNSGASTPIFRPVSSMVTIPPKVTSLPVPQVVGRAMSSLSNIRGIVCSMTLRQG